MTINPSVHAYLEQLLDSSLFGTTIEEVMERLICEQLRTLLKEGFLRSLPPTPLGPRCPKCGSPKLNDISGMGVPEVQCLDCDHRFQP